MVPGLSLEVILILFTIFISATSYRAQVRSGVRESLEQIEDVELASGAKVGTILHRFAFRGIKRLSTSVILVKFYQLGYNPASASTPVNDYFLNWGNRQLLALRKYVKRLDSVTIVEPTDDGLEIWCMTHDPVVVRRVAEKALMAVEELRGATEDEIEEFERERI